MVINELLYVNANEFFERLGESLAHDISEASGKKQTVAKLASGLEYKKKLRNKLGGKGFVKIRIDTWDVPHCYAASFTSAQGVNTLSYEIEEIDEHSIGVTYSEDFKGASALKAMNFKLMSLIYQRGAKKRAKRLLRAIEAYIKKANDHKNGGQ